MIRKFAFLAILAATTAYAADHPAFDTHQSPRFAMEVKVVDQAAAASLAESILVTKGGLTPEEASAKIRVNGQIDLARCVEFILLDSLAGIPSTLTASLDVTNVTIELQHPETTPSAPAALKATSKAKR